MCTGCWYGKACGAEGGVGEVVQVAGIERHVLIKVGVGESVKCDGTERDVLSKV